MVGLCATAASAAVQIVPLGGEIAVSQPDGDFEGFANVAANRQGGWGVAWHVENLDFDHPSGRQRRLLRDGEVLPGSLLDLPLRYPDLGLDGEGYVWSESSSACRSVASRSMHIAPTSRDCRQGNPPGR
ncbi:MAG: hypothetical protein R2862_01170 [Thermoanaerobaculia bacterium]